MLAMQLQIGLRDAVRVGHVVVGGRSGPPVRAGAVFLRPADRGVDRHIGDVDALRHQFPRHALGESGLGMACHGKGAALGEALECSTCVREDDRSFRAAGVRLVFAHQASGLLTDQFRRVSSAMPGSASVMALPKMPETRPSMLCTTSVGAPRSRTMFWNSSSTAAGSLASHAYRRTPCDVSRACRTGLSGVLAATPTRIPLSANNLAQLELMPGPPPTMRATSCTEGWVSRWSSWVMFVLCPGMAEPALAPHLLQPRECDPTGRSLAWRGRAEVRR